MEVWNMCSSYAMLDNNEQFGVKIYQKKKRKYKQR